MTIRRVYIETTIISYLTSRPSRDLVQAAWQQQTRQWWESRRRRFDLFVSQFVLDEAADGDGEAAARRMESLVGIPVLVTEPAAVELAEVLLARRLLPPKAATDALHLSMATVHRMDVLLTWNCKHLANPVRLAGINRAIRAAGLEPPFVYTPHELMED